MAAGLVLALSLAACAQLPQQVDRPVSHAIEPAAETPLARTIDARRAATGATEQSGFMLLSGAPAAYGSRLAIIESAQRSLDLQYYAIHADASTVRLLSAVRDAARRGVRVRILLDDFHTTGRDALVMRLAFESGIEMRMFNPLSGARASSLGRVLTSITEAKRIQQRMHNKLFIADNVAAVTGGRNLGDEYFGNSQKGNFVDLDVLAAGPVVRDLSRSFDAYWNDERAYPVQSLVSARELRTLRRDLSDSPSDANAEGEPEAAQSDAKPGDGRPTAEQRAWAWDQKPLDLATADFVWAPSLVLTDKPGKIEPARSAEAPASQTSSPGLEVKAAPDARGDGRVQAIAAVASGGDTVVDGLLHLVDRARTDLLIISPYFVPGPEIEKALANAHDRGVRVRVLTNSLASNDAPIAHVGYARHREDLLRMGVELYEMRSESSGLGSAFGSSGTGSGGASRSMLHSKAMVLDGRLLVIGSMNLDLRSQHQNTEMALAILSEPLCRSAVAQVEDVLRTDAWRVERDGSGLVWRAPRDSRLQDAHEEPDSTASQRLLLRILGPLAPDAML